MRALALGLLGTLTLALSFATADGAPSNPNITVAAPPLKGILAATHKCGKGQHWVGAGYAKHGKYRAAHCAPN
jgi:hypothetical protein